MAGDLPSPARPGGHDDQVVTMEAHPHRLVGELIGHRVADPADQQQAGAVDPASPAERHGVGVEGDRCSRARSSTSTSAGARQASRCPRPSTCSQKLSPMAASSGRSRSRAGGSSWWGQVGLASRTVGSEPPLDSGSAGTQVWLAIR